MPETFTVDQLAEAVKANDADRARRILDAQPDLVRADIERTETSIGCCITPFTLVLPEMVRLLMQHGADARKGV